MWSNQNFYVLCVGREGGVQASYLSSAESSPPPKKRVGGTGRKQEKKGDDSGAPCDRQTNEPLVGTFIWVKWVSEAQ